MGRRLSSSRCSYFLAESEGSSLGHSMLAAAVLVQLLPIISGSGVSGLQRTFSKDGEIYLDSCRPGEELFVGSSELWPSCSDALAHTWTADVGLDIVGLSREDRSKLVRSNGYCPQLRCQLGNISNADPRGSCPAGLCYMKLENAAVSFGACCFVNGHFNSNGMIGFYNKSQPTPKPIYKTHRVVLGPDPSDESVESFINANEVYPGIIAMQCPLLGYPEGFLNTMDDVKTMLVEQNVSLWVSLAPVVEKNVSIEYLTSMLRTHTLKCNMFPLLLMLEHGGHLSSNTLKSSKTRGTRLYWNISYSLPAHFPPSPSDLSGHQVEHIWYMRWKDFGIPPLEDENFIHELATYVAKEIRRGRRVVVNCLSGRGRSGTFIAMVAAILEGSKTVSDVVDIIVRLRRSRDGLVELPQQLRFIVRTLGLGDTALCGFQCQLSASLGTDHNVAISAFVSGVVFSLCIIWLTRLFVGRVGQAPTSRQLQSKGHDIWENQPLLGLKLH